MKFDIAVIGAGSGGLSVAAAAAQFGQKVVLFEKGKMGGDCLNYGCVPSKALIAAAKHAQALRDGAPFGIAAGEPGIDFSQVMAHVHRTIAAIEPHDSQERMEGLGITVVRGEASFRDSGTVVANGNVYEARRFVIATGSRAAIPPIPGLESVPYFTNETLFDNKVLPSHLIIIGAGPIGIEMGQAFRRLGSAVTVVEGREPLAKDDPELADVVLAVLRSEGVQILSRSPVRAVRHHINGVAVEIEGAVIEGSHLLLATGRRPNTEGLGLDAAGIAHSAKGITVDGGLKTTNRRVYAIGDVTGGPQFTHAASHQAGLVIRNALFRLRVRHDPKSIPWVTFSDPELAQAGLTEAAARRIHGDAIKVLRSPFARNDRALTEAATNGLVKVIASPRGGILGVGIAGANAGELIQPWLVAMASGLTLKSMIGVVLPYPTRGEANHRAAINFFSSLATNPWVRRVINMLGRFG